MVQDTLLTKTTPGGMVTSQNCKHIFMSIVTSLDKGHIN